MFFLYHTEENQENQVRLCGYYKKCIGRSSNLHELGRIKRKASSNKVFYIRKPDTCRQQTLLPVVPVSADDAFNMVFVNRSAVRTSRERIRGILESTGDSQMYGQRNLGIGNDGRQENGVGSATLRAFHTDDPESDDGTVRQLHLPGIVCMDGQASGMTAGTGQLVELKGVNDRIIKIL